MKFFPLTILVVSGLIYSCSEPSGIGSNFIQNGDLGVLYIDTVSIKASTVFFDSVPTSTASRLLIGHHNDEDLGPLTCKTYFKLIPGSSTNIEETNTRYSRISLVLKYDTYSYYDTSALHTFSVHRVTENMETETDGKLYSTSEFDYDPIPLGQIDFLPRPNKTDSLEIPISDELGEQLYDLVKIGSKSISNADDFQKLIRGLVVTPDSSIDGAILGFSTEAELRLYYIDFSGEETEEEYITFSVSGSSEGGFYFNSIKSDRSDTNLKDLKSTRYALNSALTDEKFYLQGGALGMRIEFPYINSILRDNGNLIISDAILEIIPIHKSDQFNTGLPEELSVNGVNEKNEIQYAYPKSIDLVTNPYDRNTYYQLDVEQFIKQQLSIDEFNGNALMITLPDAEVSSSVTRLYAGDQKNQYEMIVKIHVVTVNDED